MRMMPALVEVGQHLLGDVRDVPGDLLGPELGVAGVDLVLLDVDRGQDVVLDDALAEDDRVLVVVALPGMNATSRLVPSAISASSVQGPSAIGDPSSRRCPSMTRGPLVDAGAWFERRNFASR
jgi:hypothetical protein